MKETDIKVPAELFALAESSRFEGRADVPTLAIGPDDYAFDGPLTWEVEITNTGSALLVEGTVTASGTCACARCLEDVHHDFEGEIEGYFLVHEQEGGSFEDDEGEEIGEDEFDVLPDDHVIDLMPLIEAALVVDAPEPPLCREDCKGLCQQCGANLNEGPCDCGPDEDLAAFDKAANPFSVLEGLSFN